MSYDKTDIRVYASDLRQITQRIEIAVENRKPHKGSWASIEKRMNDAANVLWKILTDLDGDQ